MTRKVLLLSLLLTLMGCGLPTKGATPAFSSEPVLADALEDLDRFFLLWTTEESTPDIWPTVGPITSDYGWRKRRRGSEFHAGVDIGSSYGSKVVASAPGYVLFVGWVKGYGNTVLIYHGNGYATLYAHLSSTQVKKGEMVSKNKVIGYVGSSGRTTGPHLHYEVIKYGIRQNPLVYLP